MKTLLYFVHPQPRKSRVNRTLRAAVETLGQVTLRDLYELYPDFYIDVRREQEALLAHELIVFQHPFYWYSAPALLKEWLDSVLARGWAYGRGGDKMMGKQWLQAISTGGSTESYSSTGRHGFTLAELLRPFEATARLCGMHWHQPFLVQDALDLDQAAIERHARAYRSRLEDLTAAPSETASDHA